MQQLYNNFSYLMSKLGVKQIELSESIGCSQSTISKIANKNGSQVGIGTYEAIAKSFGLLHAGELFDCSLVEHIEQAKEDLTNCCTDSPFNEGTFANLVWTIEATPDD